MAVRNKDCTQMIHVTTDTTVYNISLSSVRLIPSSMEMILSNLNIPKAGFFE